VSAQYRNHLRGLAAEQALDLLSQILLRDGAGSVNREPPPKGPVRDVTQLIDIRDRYGSPFFAAICGAVSAEEYLKLEKLNEN
jgi:hypothetical protein